MTIDVITIFPELFKSFLNTSLIKKSRDKKIIQINIHNLRDYTSDKHNTVDDKPFGGGPGMLLKAEPIFKAVESLKKTTRRVGRKSKSSLKKEADTKVFLLSPKGKLFDQKKAKDLSKLDNIILICGRYEGVDERVAKYLVDEEISIGNYILSGGEVPAMVIIETVTRLIPGVVGNKYSIESDYGFPQYTRPEYFKGMKVPKVLLSGNHEEITKWRAKKARKDKP